MGRQESYISRVRDKVKSKKQSNVWKVGMYKPKVEVKHMEVKKFERACNCERHRRKRLGLDY